MPVVEELNVDTRSSETVVAMVYSPAVSLSGSLIAFSVQFSLSSSSSSVWF